MPTTPDRQDDWEIEVEEVSLWAAQPLVELLQQEAKKYGFDTIMVEVTVSVRLEHVEFSREPKADATALHEHLTDKFHVYGTCRPRD